MEVIQLSDEIEIAHLGPPLDKGRLPAVFYFALSAQESLELDPYNQPAVYLAKQGIRVFSLNLPSHGPNLNALDAIERWAQAFKEDKDLLAPFIEQTLFAIDTLFDKGLTIREKIGFMGLSRGGLISCLVGAKFPDVRAIVGFAPMTELTYAKEFVGLQEKANKWNLTQWIESLWDKKIRFYIGNRDIRVGTDKCFQFTQLLVEKAFENGLRSPPIEMIISPSIGHMGHGTSKEIFEAGAHFLGKTLGAIK